MGLQDYSWNMIPFLITLYKEDYTEEVKFLKKFFSLFMVDQRNLDTNILRLSDRFSGLSVEKIENLPFWRYEQFIDIANELAKEDKARQEEQKPEKSPQMPNTNSMLSKMGNMANKFKSGR